MCFVTLYPFARFQILNGLISMTPWWLISGLNELALVRPVKPALNLIKHKLVEMGVVNRHRLSVPLKTR